MGIYASSILTYVGVGSVIILVVATTTDYQYANHLEQTTHRRLLETAQTIGSLIGHGWPSQRGPRIQDQAMEIAKSTDVRVSLVTRDGRVLADSEAVASGELDQIDQRPFDSQLLKAQVGAEPPPRSRSCAQARLRIVRGP